MRVYLSKLPDYIPNKISNLKKIKTYTKTTLVSNEGLFLINNDQIYKIKYEDDDIKQIKIKNEELICDKSKVFKQKWTKIPLTFDIIKRNVYEYLDYKNFKITIELNDSNKIKDIYFDTDDEENLIENLNTLVFD